MSVLLRFQSCWRVEMAFCEKCGDKVTYRTKCLDCGRMVCYICEYFEGVDDDSNADDEKGRCCHNDFSYLTNERRTSCLEAIAEELEDDNDDDESYIEFIMKDPNEEHSVKLKSLEEFLISIKVEQDDQRVWEHSPMT